MATHLDLDDVAAQSPLALRELQELRAALRTVAHAHAWREFGECRAYGDLPMLRPSEVDAVARLALGMPAVPTK